MKVTLSFLAGICLVLGGWAVARADTPPNIWFAGMDANELVVPSNVEVMPPPPEMLDPIWIGPAADQGDQCVAMNNGNEAMRDCYVGNPEHPLPDWLVHFND